MLRLLKYCSTLPKKPFKTERTPKKLWTTVAFTKFEQNLTVVVNGTCRGVPLSKIPVTLCLSITYEYYGPPRVRNSYGFGISKIYLGPLLCFSSKLPCILYTLLQWYPENFWGRRDFLVFVTLAINGWCWAPSPSSQPGFNVGSCQHSRLWHSPWKFRVDYSPSNPSKWSIPRHRQVPVSS